MKHFFLSLLTVAVLAATSHAATVGQSAPDFTLTDIQGNTHSLSDFSGKYVVLEWMSPACPFVKKFYEAGEMQRMQAEMSQKGVIWLTIDSTNPGHRAHMDAKEAKGVAKAWNIQSAALMLDEDGAVGRAFQARTTPHMFVIDPHGILIYQGAIDSIRSSDSRDIARAENYVLSALTASKSGQPILTSSTQPYGCTIKY